MLPKTSRCSTASSELAVNLTSIPRSGWSTAWKTSTSHLSEISQNFCRNLLIKVCFRNKCLLGRILTNPHNIKQAPHFYQCDACCFNSQFAYCTAQKTALTIVELNLHIRASRKLIYYFIVFSNN